MQRLSVIRGRFGILASLILAMAISLPAAAGTITTVAGNGTESFSGDGGFATNAGLAFPSSVAVDTAGNFFIADLLNQRVRRVDAVTGIITTVAGNGSFGFNGDGMAATSASLAFPSSVAVDAAGNVFIADVSNQRIRRVDAATGIITTVAGNGTAGFSGDGSAATSASLNDPIGVAVDGVGNLFIADTFNQRVRRVDAATGIITTVAGNGTFGFNGDGGLATDAWMRDPVGVAVDSAGNLFITDQNNQRIRRVDAATGTMSTVAGSGTFGFGGDGGLATDASLSRPTGAALDSAGNLFIADQSNQRVRRVDAATGFISTVAGDGSFAFSGDGGLATDACLKNPAGVAVDSAGNLFIADQSNHRIRHVEGSGTVGGGDGGGGGGDVEDPDPYPDNGKKPLPERANKWGELRGKDRAGKVHLMNESAKESR